MTAKNITVVQRSSEERIEIRPSDIVMVGQDGVGAVISVFCEDDEGPAPVRVRESFHEVVEQLVAAGVEFGPWPF